MWTVRDQIQAYQFLPPAVGLRAADRRRQQSRLAQRRLMLAYAVGVAVMLIAVAVIGIYTVMRRGR
jgi:hypothetical protein